MLLSIVVEAIYPVFNLCMIHMRYTLVLLLNCFSDLAIYPAFDIYPSLVDVDTPSRPKDDRLASASAYPDFETCEWRRCCT
jgi:hypothetical protein